MYAHARAAQHGDMDDDTLTDWSDARLLAALFDGSTADRLLRRCGGLRQVLDARWGPPDFDDGEVAVWDLDRVRASLP